MQRLSVLVMVAVIACSGYGIHLYKNYTKIQKDLAWRSARIVRPSVDDQSVSEIGYIFSMRRDTYVREARLNLVWFIAVPSEDSRWSCAYEAGYPDFKVGDGVQIIHKKSDTDAAEFTGYIIGLHGKERGKTTEVWGLDLDELEPEVEN